MRKIPEDLDVKYLKEVFEYQPSDGSLVWRFRQRSLFKSDRAFKAWNIRFAGKVAGGMDRNGYVIIKLRGLVWFGHRLVYALNHGYFPEKGIDHINQNKSDNRIENLREADQSLNTKNRRISRTNKSGVNGVSWHKALKKWRVDIQVDGKPIYLGLFVSKDEAAAVSVKARSFYGFHENHGRSIDS